jgi:SSS family solute:Na+ symporter
VIALLANLLVSTLVTFALRAVKRPYGRDVTASDDYVVEAGEPGVEPLPATPDQEVTT